MTLSQEQRARLEAAVARRFSGAREQAVRRHHSIHAGGFDKALASEVEDATVPGLRLADLQAALSYIGELETACRQAQSVLVQLTEPNMNIGAGQVYFQARAAEFACRSALSATKLDPTP